jgi:HTH-type transcriptional regulator/antitoxin MqsA
VPNLSGWECESCHEIVFDPGSAQRYAEEGDRLIQEERDVQRLDIRRIREKLDLTQAQAAKLTGGGHNAFSRYERGEAVPMPAVVNLFRLLDRHPDLLSELGVAEAGRDSGPPEAM